MDLFLETLSEELSRRVERNPRYSLRAFATSLGLHVSALSRIMSGKQLLSAQSSVKVAKKLRLSPDERRAFLNSVIDAHGRKSKEKMGVAVEQPGLRHDRAEAPDEARPEIERVHYAALMELSMTKGFAWDAAWISERLQTPADRTRQMMDVLMKSGMLAVRDGKVAKINRDTTSVGCLSDENRKACQAEILQLTEQSLMTRSKGDHTQFTMVLAINPSKIEEVRTRFLGFLDEMGDLLQTGERTEVCALGVQLFPLTHPVASRLA